MGEQLLFAAYNFGISHRRKALARQLQKGLVMGQVQGLGLEKDGDENGHEQRENGTNAIGNLQGRDGKAIRVRYALDKGGDPGKKQSTNDGTDARGKANQSAQFAARMRMSIVGQDSRQHARGGRGADGKDEAEPLF